MTRVALVTGAAGDLGRAACLGLARDGWSLVIADHPAAADKLEATRSVCAAAGAQVVEATFDVTELDAVEGSLAQLAERGRTPTAIVAGAGVQGEFAPVHEYEASSFRRVLDVNVAGVFNCIGAAARLMARDNTGGTIVVLASMAGVNGAPNMPAYAASKAAVIGLVKSAARDLAPHGIRVNAVSPGFIGPGAMWDNQVARQAAAGSQYFAADAEQVATQMIDSIPLRRYGSPAEVAEVICFLASERSSYLTGTNIEISGGAF
ncbi:MAG TPA: SDR family NAD(P)-dependent oxidoreductase [Thermoleophilaceae bacterium]|jgi:NAD(P)-dependent dehydrogenase (short-subunit alcohol dehydrogenase family)|nr:SDR family NAD(P)-dependent oxidoreductase [Thermoleophilaceae bacterium]